MYEQLKQEFEYYLDHQQELVKKYNDKHIVIKGREVIGVYDSDLEAIEETSNRHEIGTFLVQPVGPGKENYTMTFHSGVTFN